MDAGTVALRVQSYLAADRLAHVEAPRRAFTIGPCVVVLDPSNDALDENLAYPGVRGESEAVDAVDVWLADLRAAFARADRRPVLRWLDAALPRLGDELGTRGFHEQTREALFACVPALLRPPTALPEVTIEAVDAQSSLAAIRENLDTNAFGFDPTGASMATDEQAAEFRPSLQQARAFTARWEGQAAGAGMYTDPDGGVAELVGIATLAGFRGRGIAQALTARMVQAAFAAGCDLVFLTTTNPTAARVYHRVGFGRVGDLLVYAADSAPAVSVDTPGGA